MIELSDITVESVYLNTTGLGDDVGILDAKQTTFFGGEPGFDGKHHPSSIICSFQASMDGGS